MADEHPPTDGPRDDGPRMALSRVRERLTRRPTGWAALVPVIALGAGLLFATSSATARGTDLRSDVVDLPDVIRERTIANERSGQRVERLRGEVNDLTRAADPGSKKLSALQSESKQRALTAGLTPVAGPGLTVSLDDAHLSSDAIPEGFTVDDVIIHQQDVQGVVNALWRGGAEAMQIMDQRVVSTSAVRCVGNTLILQGRVYSPPFVITAVGNPKDLQSALDEDPSVDIFRQYVDAVGLGYEVSTVEQAELPAFGGRTLLEHATALPDGR